MLMRRATTYSNFCLTCLQLVLPSISSQFTLEVRAAAENRKKSQKITIHASSVYGSAFCWQISCSD